MQPLTIGILAAAATVANAENIAVALNSDINANLAEYLSVIQEQTGDAVTQLMALYAAGKTYTDDSYTTLIDSAEYAMLSSFVTELPWYSSRLETAIEAQASATSEASSAAPSESSSAAPSESSSVVPSESSSAAPSETSSVAPTSASSSASNSSVSSASETSASSITETSSSTAGANALVPGALAGAFIGALALL